MLPGPSGPAARGSGPAQARAFDLALAAWSSGPHDGATPGNRHLTRQGLSDTALRAVFSNQARTRGLSEEQGRGVPVQGSIYAVVITIMLSRKAVITCFCYCLL